MDCLIGSLNLAMGAAKAGVSRFVGIGTCLEYDLSSGVITVDTKLNPLSPYAAAKTALFLNLSQWLPLHSIEFAWCRLFYLHGEGEDVRRLVPYIHRQLKNSEDVKLTDGRQIRDFMDVSEAGSRVAQIAVGKHTGPVNICSGNPVTVRQLAESIADRYGRRDLLKFGAIPERENDPFCVIGMDNLKNNSRSKDES
jgi:dTDP-6-deoxy-L-talose 4-dehydrogenase (NAD+)